MKYSVLILFMLPSWGICQPPNCNVFLWNQDTALYEACTLVRENIDKYYQFDPKFHELMHRAIEIAPNFAYAYRELGAPFVKTGNFIEWKKYMDQAVKYAPLDYLPVRASLRYKFFADYEGTIKDIDHFESLINYDVGETSNGTYHLNIVKGLCYKKLAQPDTAIQIIEKQLQQPNHLSLYDHLHLGVLYLEKGGIEKALSYFEQQSANNELADNCYYQALCFLKLAQREQAKAYLQKAKELFTKGRKMHDGYNRLIDQVYFFQIEEELAQLQE
ncbi:MAG: hypothetical protein AAF847_10075 [Bacteroidota bacterium]